MRQRVKVPRGTTLRVFLQQNGSIILATALCAMILAALLFVARGGAVYNTVSEYLKNRFQGRIANPVSAGDNEYASHYKECMKDKQKYDDQKNKGDEDREDMKDEKDNRNENEISKNENNAESSPENESLDSSIKIHYTRKNTKRLNDIFLKVYQLLTKDTKSEQPGSSLIESVNIALTKIYGKNKVTVSFSEEYEDTICVNINDKLYSMAFSRIGTESNPSKCYEEINNKYVANAYLRFEGRGTDHNDDILMWKVEDYGAKIDHSTRKYTVEEKNILLGCAITKLKNLYETGFQNNARPFENFGAIIDPKTKKVSGGKLLAAEKFSVPINETSSAESFINSINELVSLLNDEENEDSHAENYDKEHPSYIEYVKMVMGLPETVNSTYSSCSLPKFFEVLLNHSFITTGRMN